MGASLEMKHSLLSAYDLMLAVALWWMKLVSYIERLQYLIQFYINDIRFPLSNNSNDTFRKPTDSHG